MEWTLDNANLNERRFVDPGRCSRGILHRGTNECGTAEACAEVQIFVPIPNPCRAYSLNCEGGNTVLVDPLTDNDWTVTWEDGTVGRHLYRHLQPHHDTVALGHFRRPPGLHLFEDSTFVWMGYPVELGTSEPIIPSDRSALFLCPEIPNTFQINSRPCCGLELVPDSSLAPPARATSTSCKKTRSLYLGPNLGHHLLVRSTCS